MKIYYKQKKRRKEEFQFFMHDFLDACREAGFASRPDVLPDYKYKIRAVCREALWRIYSLLHTHFPRLLLRREALLVAANGSNLIDNSFPYWGRYEIVPMLWDVWPASWPRLLAALRVLDVRTCLVSSSQAAEMIRREAGITAYHIPEGITASHYRGGAEPCKPLF